MSNTQTRKYNAERDAKIRALADQVAELAAEVYLERAPDDAYTRRELVSRIGEVIDRAVGRLK